jgi:hypothetical protein
MIWRLHWYFGSYWWIALVMKHGTQWDTFCVLWYFSLCTISPLWWERKCWRPCRKPSPSARLYPLRLITWAITVYRLYFFIVKQKGKFHKTVIWSEPLCYSLFARDVLIFYPALCNFVCYLICYFLEVYLLSQGFGNKELSSSSRRHWKHFPYLFSRRWGVGSVVGRTEHMNCALRDLRQFVHRRFFRWFVSHVMWSRSYFLALTRMFMYSI